MDREGHWKGRKEGKKGKADGQTNRNLEKMYPKPVLDICVLGFRYLIDAQGLPLTFIRTWESTFLA